MKKSIRADEKERFLRSCDLICWFPTLSCHNDHPVRKCLGCSSVAKPNMEAWGGKCPSLQKAHLTGCSLNCLLSDNWRKM